MNDTNMMLDKVKILNLINYKIAELIQDKEQLEAQLLAESGHGDEGSKTYKIGTFKCTITTGYIYSLNKEEYEIMKSRLPKEFDPVKTKISYEVNPKIMKDAEKYASKEDLLLLSDVISKKNKKPHFKIQAGV
ncbi:MAG: hypothetical protein KBD04_07245 [Proteobacteria bacterium]|nr:hypothetical protein [Pseudomonadota bacterium]